MAKRGRSKKINFNLSNRLSYTLIAIFLLAAVGIGVYALAPGVVPNPGHNISEMSVPSPCSANQVLTYDGTNWICGDSEGLKTKVIPVGDWNMDQYSTKGVAHGLNSTKIIGLQLLIINDNGLVTGGIVGGGSTVAAQIAWNFDATTISLSRLNAPSQYDAVDYDATPFNRGWIILKYLP